MKKTTGIGLGTLPAFSSSRFLAASALCCRISAKRSASPTKGDQ
jgi:hypothetical protein